MATTMTNTVDGVVAFRTPVLLMIDHKPVYARAVKGVWTTNATGTDGKITVKEYLPDSDTDAFVKLKKNITLDTIVAGTAAVAANIVSVQ